VPEKGLILRPNKTNNESWDAVRVFYEDGVWKADFLEVTLQESHQAVESVLRKSFQQLCATAKIDCIREVALILWD